MSADQNTKYRALTVTFKISGSDEWLQDNGYPSREALLDSAFDIAQNDGCRDIEKGEASVTGVFEAPLDEFQGIINDYKSGDAVLNLQRSFLVDAPFKPTVSRTPHNDKTEIIINIGQPS